jgi:hypothetical protein
MDDAKLDHERTQQRVGRIQRQHEAAKERDRPHELALKEQDETKQRQRVWIIPEFDTGVAESEHLIETIRTPLPAYNCQLAHAPGVSEREIYELINRDTSTDDPSA